MRLSPWSIPSCACKKSSRKLRICRKAFKAAYREKLNALVIFKPPNTPVEIVLDYYDNDYEIAEPPRVTSLKNTQPLPTITNFGESFQFVHESRRFKSIVHHLAKAYLASDNETITDPRLKLNKVVCEVEYTKKGVKVTTENGEVYTSDYVIVSVSLGVLQSKLIDFVPDFPFWKLKAIYTSNIANLDNEFPGKNILMVTVADEETRRIEQQEDSETLHEIIVVLRNMFGSKVPEAESIYLPRWLADPFFKDTFSNWSIRVESNIFKQLQVSHYRSRNL
ncbi:polyamine oxidase 1 [Physcomitrium patens]|uniref:polyamine oxidase 1 n=1 Tax=Physcomitrium patens TaxID=3218 RepID=UPI000D15D208|nr:polyamine oxidase-like [Physcomitrium patens]|eukprot:XP_024394658.1 polyamine oxidase-like [Physcomitrella patens]